MPSIPDLIALARSQPSLPSRTPRSSWARFVAVFDSLPDTWNARARVDWIIANGGIPADDRKRAYEAITNIVRRRRKAAAAGATTTAAA